MVPILEAYVQYSSFLPKDPLRFSPTPLSIPERLKLISTAYDPTSPYCEFRVCYFVALLIASIFSLILSRQRNLKLFRNVLPLLIQCFGSMHRRRIQIQKCIVYAINLIKSMVPKMVTSYKELNERYLVQQKHIEVQKSLIEVSL